MKNENEKLVKKSTDGFLPVDVILPNANLLYWIHDLRLSSSLCSESKKLEAKQNIMKEIERDEMLVLYDTLCTEFKWDVDEGLMNKLRESNELEKEKLENALREATENFGDVEIKDAVLSQAHFQCRIGNVNAAVKLYQDAYGKTVGSGSKLDVILTLIRIGLLYGRAELATKNLEIAKIESEKGGDWDRRNKLKVYEGMFLLQKRKFNDSVKLLLDCISIFTANELMSYESFIFCTVLLSLLCLERTQLRSSVVNSPEVASVLAEDPLLRDFLHSYFHCNYSLFLHSLVSISSRIQRDFFLSRHLRFYIRAIRLKAYKQFLDPFQSVTLKSMAKTFTCCVEFIEADVADFISNRKLHCKIDRVRGIVECETKNQTTELYTDPIKQGDVLLNKVQKLSKIFDM